LIAPLFYLSYKINDELLPWVRVCDTLLEKVSSLHCQSIGGCIKSLGTDVVTGDHDQSHAMLANKF